MSKKGVKTPKEVSWQLACEQAEQIAKDIIAEGRNPPLKRAVFYLMRKARLFGKKDRTGDYGTLTRELARREDRNEIDWRAFSTKGAGVSEDKLTEAEIVKQIKIWNATLPAKLNEDGYYPVILIEHGALVDDLDMYADYKVPIFSCEGNIRHGYLRSSMERVLKVNKALNGNGVKVFYLGDYDDHGRDIGEFIRDWIADMFSRRIQFEWFGVTAKHMTSIGCTVTEDMPLDGWIDLYGWKKVAKELKEALRLK